MPTNNVVWTKDFDVLSHVFVVLKIWTYFFQLFSFETVFKCDKNELNTKNKNELKCRMRVRGRLDLDKLLSHKQKLQSF